MCLLLSGASVPSGLMAFVLGERVQLVPGGTELNGRPLRFLNDVELLNDTVYFTDSSSTWDRRHIVNIILEQKGDGR